MGARPPHLKLVTGGTPPAVIAPALELAALGAGLTLTITLLAGLPPWFRALGAFQALAAVAFAFFGLALWRAHRYRALPHAGLAVFGVALACRVILLPVAPSLSGDIHRYVWEGRVAAHGGNPYRQAPDDPALAGLRDPLGWTPINHKHLSTIYPPGAIAGFAMVASISPTVTGFKGWVILHDLALVLVLLAWSRRRGTGAIPVIAYAWNPLVLIEYAGTGHHDPTAMLWLAIALVIAERRPAWSALALALGVMVKLAPLVALPFLWRRWPWRARVMAAAPIAIGLGWFWAETRHARSGVNAYFETWRNNELVFHYLAAWTGSDPAARVLAAALVAVAVAWAWRRVREAGDAARQVTRVAVLVGPVAHPWYFGWAMMFEPLRPSAPWLLLSLTVLLNYGLLVTPAEGRAFHLPLAWRWVEYGAPALVAAALVWSRRRAAPHAREEDHGVR